MILLLVIGGLICAGYVIIFAWWMQHAINKASKYHDQELVLGNVNKDGSISDTGLTGTCVYADPEGCEHGWHILTVDESYTMQDGQAIYWLSSQQSLSPCFAEQLSELSKDCENIKDHILSGREWDDGRSLLYNLLNEVICTGGVPMSDFLLQNHSL